MKYINLTKEMPNLRGEIGEIIAKHTIKSCFRPKEYTTAVLRNFKIPELKANFLLDNWKIIDLLHITEDVITVFEVKSKKFNYRKLTGAKNMPKITNNFAGFYNQGKALGIKFKLVQITFFESWKCGLVIKDLEIKECHIDSRVHHRGG